MLLLTLCPLYDIMLCAAPSQSGSDWQLKLLEAGGGSVSSSPTNANLCQLTTATFDTHHLQISKKKEWTKPKPKTKSFKGAEGCHGDAEVRQKSQPMEQPWDHQRQGWPPPPFSRAEPSSQGPLLAQVQPVDLLLPFWNPSTTRSKAFRLVGILKT